MVKFNALDFAIPASAMAKVVQQTKSEFYDDKQPSPQKGSALAAALAMIILVILWICLIVVNIQLIQKIPVEKSGPRIATIILLVIGIFNPIFLVISIIVSLFSNPKERSY